MANRRPTDRSPVRSRRGFALLLTLTLLAFVVLLLVGLATYTRVETSIAGNMQQQAQARENALLALNVALGQLQKHAGPDRRVTATAEQVAGVDVQKRYYTGVWDSDPAAGGSAVTPIAWLASGAEAASGVDITASVEASRRVILVGAKSDGSTLTNGTVAELQDIRAPGVPGSTGNQITIGRYAWWIGDQGVKAPVAVPDNTDAIDYAPFVDGVATDLRARIRQQLSIGAGAADTTSGAPVFEPHATENQNLIGNDKISAVSQFAFLRNTSNAPLGLGAVRTNFHSWSANNFAVLANTKQGGLRQDLSLDPAVLGDAFTMWATPAGYMEKFKPETVPEPVSGEAAPAPAPVTPVIGPAILPAYSEDPIRRRYVMTPHQTAGNGSHQVAPVLTDFGITFNVHTVNESEAANAPLEVRAAWMLSFWNPYSSALVPEDLRVEISGLPTITLIKEGTTLTAARGSLQGLYSASGQGALVLRLPWDAENIPSTAPSEDRKSWLPGRVYTWRSIEDTSKGDVPSDGYMARFYTRSFTEAGETNGGVQRPIAGTVDGRDLYFLDVSGPGRIEISFYVVRNGEKLRLGGLESPLFQSRFQTTARAISANTWQFGYAFRLKESVDTIATPSEWLTTATIDFRRLTLQPEAYRFDRDDNPATYENRMGDFMTAKHDRLLFRAGDGYSYNEDVPLFELPRGPILSLGALQHFRIRNSRPFMIGNSWGVNAELNNIRLGELFDRFYFSGLVEGIVPSTTATGDLRLPNPLLKPLRKPDRTKVTIDDVRALMNPPATTTTDADGNVVTTPAGPSNSYSSKFFLQGGAFNLNSTNAAAWVAMLRGIRFPTDASVFKYLEADPLTGTAADLVATQTPSSNAQFFRFSQSAQETYKAEPGQASGDPATPSPANTHLFRRGMRTLTAPQLAALAAKIAELVRVKQASTDPVLGGPFRSLEEFLSPSPVFAGVDADGNPLAPRSLLEAAITDANINVDENGLPIEFSSQFLTQADIMTALAPILFPRSDTFVIRTHGQSLNSATSAIEGRAWCEAIVQRVPEYFDPSIPAETLPSEFEDEATEAEKLNKLYGRRFKVISFRWLTRSDI